MTTIESNEIELKVKQKLLYVCCFMTTEAKKKQIRELIECHQNNLNRAVFR